MDSVVHDRYRLGLRALSYKSVCQVLPVDHLLMSLEGAQVWGENSSGCEVCPPWGDMADTLALLIGFIIG